MNDTASALTHASRANIFQTGARWRLGADALMREGGEPASAPWYAHAARIFLRVIWPWTGIKIEPGGAARFPYAGITELRLSYDPTRVDTRRHRCDVRSASGAGTLWSTHFTGVADFEDRAATYTPFMRALSRTLRPPTRPAHSVPARGRSPIGQGSSSCSRWRSWRLG